MCIKSGDNKRKASQNDWLNQIPYVNNEVKLL